MTTVNISTERKKKTGEDFKAAANKHQITNWIIHYCSFCNYPCGYHFDLKSDKVFYDNGCDCSFASRSGRVTNWDDVAKHYNLQNTKKALDEYDAFWHFPSNNN